MYKLDIFEKGFRFIKIISLELEPDDYDRFRTNMILEVGIDSEQNFRMFNCNNTNFSIDRKH
jgi:hypothetical protein